MAVMLAAAMLFTGAVILGNHLRSEAEATDGESRGEETTLPDFDASSVPSVIARYAVFGGDAPGEPGKVPADEAAHGQGSGDETATPDVTVPAVPETDAAPAETTGGDVSDAAAPAKYSYNAYCVVMRGPDGGLHYRSDVRSVLLGAKDDEQLTELADGVARFGGTYLSGVFCATYPAAAGTSAAMREYEISLAAELADAGFGDILVTGLEFGQDAADFCAAVKGRTGNFGCRVGITLGYDFLSSDDARESLVRLGGSFDFIALDLSGESDAVRIDTLLHNVRALIGIYRMRVLVGNAPGLAAAALDAGAANVAEIAE